MGVGVPPPQENPGFATVDANDLKYVVIFIFSLELDVICVINVLVELWQGV